MLDSGKVPVMDGAVERGTGVEGVYSCAEVFAVGFYVRMMLIEEMVDHGDGFLGIATLARAVEGYAALRVCTAGYEVVEQLYIGRRGNEIQDLEGVVACGIDSAHRIFIASGFVCAIGVRAVVDQPVKGFPVVCKMPGDVLGHLLSVMCFDDIYSLQHLVALGFHIVAELDEEFHHVQRGW